MRDPCKPTTDLNLGGGFYLRDFNYGTTYALPTEEVVEEGGETIVVLPPEVIVELVSIPSLPGQTPPEGPEDPSDGTCFTCQIIDVPPEYQDVVAVSEGPCCWLIFVGLLFIGLTNLYKRSKH